MPRMICGLRLGLAPSLPQAARTDCRPGPSRPPLPALPAIAMRSDRRGEPSAPGYSARGRRPAYSHFSGRPTLRQLGASLSPSDSSFGCIALRRTRRDGFPGLLGLQKLGVSDDLPVVLKFRQFGAVQILAEPPELRIHVIEVNDADRRLLAADDAQRFEPVPAGDENVLAIANDARETASVVLSLGSTAPTRRRRPRCRGGSYD